MKLRSSLGSSSSSPKMAKLLVTLALFVALSVVAEKGFTQNKNVNQSGLNVKDKDNKDQMLSAKEKYFNQLLSEIQREMKVEDGKKQLDLQKENMSRIVKELRHEVFFTKEKRETSLDNIIDGFSSEVTSLESLSQASLLIDKIITFLNSLKQKVVVLGQERFTTGPKEISYDLIDTYIARFTALKVVLSQTSEEKNQNLLGSPDIIAFLLEAKAAIQAKEDLYNKQVMINDSLQGDYGNLLQLIYTLESSKIQLTGSIQEKQILQENVQKEFSTYELMGTDISGPDYKNKVALMQQKDANEKEIAQMSDSLKKVESQLVIETNLQPVKENAIKQSALNINDVQNSLLQEKTKQYLSISDFLKQQAKGKIDDQESEIQKQMVSLQKTIDAYNSGIDSLTTELKKVNDQLPSQFTTGESIIKQREISIQKLLKEYVRYSQELEKLYTVYKTILSQNKEAILKLEENNTFIKADVLGLQSQEKELEQHLESLKVSIQAKEKEKQETVDDQRVIQVINELTVLYNSLHSTEKLLDQVKQLLDQRQAFENDYLTRKNKELTQIDQVIGYLDNNIVATNYAIESFVYGYYMQLKKMEIKNIQIKVDNVQKKIEENTKVLGSLKDEELTNRRLIKDLKGTVEQINEKQKSIYVQINILVSKIRPIKETLEKDGKLLETQKGLLIDAKKNYVELANLAKTSLKGYLESGQKSIVSQKDVVGNNYPFPTMLPTNMPAFDSSIEKLFALMHDAGVDPEISMEIIQSLYKK